MPRERVDHIYLFPCPDCWELTDDCSGACIHCGCPLGEGAVTDLFRALEALLRDIVF